MHPAIRWTLPGSDDQPIFGNTHHPPDGRPPAGVLVCAHGFKGYKDYGFLPRLADRAAAAGLIAHRFNFSHSGMTERLETFEKPELFERDTWGRQVEDLTRVVERIAEPAGLPIVLFGHSRGGLTTLLTAAKLGARVAGVVSAAAPADACRLEPEQRAMLLRTGRVASFSSRTQQVLHVGRAWLEDIEADPEAVDPLRAVARLTAPLLLLHGDEDETVPPQDLRHLRAAAPAQADVEAVMIPGANHVFNAPNPMPPEAEPSPQAAALFDRTIDFALRCVR